MLTRTPCKIQRSFLIIIKTRKTFSLRQKPYKTDTTYYQVTRYEVKQLTKCAVKMAAVVNRVRSLHMDPENCRPVGECAHASRVRWQILLQSVSQSLLLNRPITSDTEGPTDDQTVQKSLRQRWICVIIK